MPESVILNQSTIWDEAIEDCMTPDYGFTRSRASTRAVAKPAGGRPWSREVTNTGHKFQLSWLNRSFKCVQRVKHFYEQYEDGFFTIIDHDGGGRHYVGRFTGDYSEVEAGNDRYNIQGLTFEELPGVPMLQYPSDWDNDAIRLFAFNDFGDLNLSIVGNWAAQAIVALDGTSISLLASTGTGGDFATYEYRGYGFQLWMKMGPGCGEIAVSIDGAAGIELDLYSVTDKGLQMILAMPALMLDLHRVRVLVNGNANIAATGAAVVWGFMQVMR